MHYIAICGIILKAEKQYTHQGEGRHRLSRHFGGGRAQRFAAGVSLREGVVGVSPAARRRVGHDVHHKVHAEASRPGGSAGPRDFLL